MADLIIAENNEQIEKPKVDRRFYLANAQKALLKATRNRVASDAKNTSAKAKQSRRIPHKIKLIRNLIQNADTDSRAPLLSLFGHSLSVNDRCTPCPLCKGICPTGALNMKRSEKGAELFFSYLDCSGCGLCVEFCKKKALSLKQHTSVSVDSDGVRLVAL